MSAASAARGAGPAAEARRGRLGLLSAPPLLAFLIVYLPTTYVGALALVAGPDWVREWYVRLSGAAIDGPDSGQILTIMVLINVAPALLFAGWALSERVVARLGAAPDPAPKLRWPRASVLGALYAVVATYLLVRLGTIGVFDNLDDWANYDSFIGGRYDIADELTFAEFVLVYSVLPMAAGALMVALLDAYRGRGLVLRALPVLGSLVVIELLLFQKLALLIALLMVALFVAFGRGARRVRTPRRAILIVASCIAAAYALYIVLLVTPVVQSRPTKPLPPVPAPPGNILADDFTDAPTRWETLGTFVLDGALKGTEPGRTGAGLGFTAAKRVQGVSRNTYIDAKPGSRWTLTVALRSDAPLQVGVYMGKREIDAGGGTVGVGPTWSTHSFEWTPRRAVDNVEVAVRAEAPGHVVIDDVRFAPQVTAPPDRSKGLKGSATLVAPPLATTFPDRDTLGPRPRSEVLFFYALLGPITRTAGPAVAYPTLYPDKHAYYPIDIGLDVAGIGVAPDDNATSFELMFPTVKGGTNNVPYQFVLYSQGGVLVALVGSVVLGLLWGLIWRLAAWLPRGLERAGLQTLLVVAGVFLATNAWRNSMLASYGLLWPALVLAAVVTARLAVSRYPPRRRALSGS